MVIDLPLADNVTQSTKLYPHTGQMGSSPGTEIPHSGQSSSDDSVRPKPGGIPFSGAGGDGAGLDGKTGF